MRRIALILIPFFFVACSGEPTAPAAAKLRAPPLASLSNGADVSQDRHDLPFNWLLTPADFPCLKESIQLSGTISEYVVFVVSQGSIHLTVHQTTDNITVTGVPSGTRYAFSGPFTWSGSGSTQLGTPLEFTFHNINHFVGPGSASDIFFRTLVHVTRYPSGEIKVAVVKDDVLCK